VTHLWWLGGTFPSSSLPPPSKSPLYIIWTSIFFGSPPSITKIHWLQKKKEHCSCVTKLSMCIILISMMNLSHSFWKGIEDMKTPGLCSLWISPIYEGKTRKKISALKSAYPSLPILKSHIYHTHTHTHTHTHSNKRVQIEGKFFLFFFPLFVGNGIGKEVCSPRFVPTPNFLFACW
jgi:hypothetical protein